MHLFELTRQLVDIESTTGMEARAAQFVADYLRGLSDTWDDLAPTTLTLEDAAPGRPNVFAAWGHPRVVFSTHLDTVPPFFPSREDDSAIHGRGSCDAKGIAACMIKAIERLRHEGLRDLGLLLVVGEERDSTGAAFANQNPRGSEFLINGEPTENLLALGSKGCLRVVLEGRGRMAHSAYPHLGESAIDKLVEALHRVSQIKWPHDELFGDCTSNTGTISGGRAPNVIPDHAHAELLIRLVGDSAPVKRAIEAACAGLVDVSFVLEMKPVRMSAREGFATTVVSFTTDIPSLTNWGAPFLLGPGSISVAHTDREHVPKRDLEHAVELYSQIGRTLLK